MTENEREVFFRNLRNPFPAPGGYESRSVGSGQKAKEAPRYHIGGIGGAVGAGLRGLASAGRLIEDDSEDPDERRKRIEAEQAGSNVGTVLGLAIGAAMALTEHSSPQRNRPSRTSRTSMNFWPRWKPRKKNKSSSKLCK